MANRWTIDDGEPDRTDKYEWHVPNLDQQHVAETTSPGALRIKPSDITLKPTKAPEQSGIQHGWNNWNNQVEPTLGGWYLYGSILQEDD